MKRLGVAALVALVATASPSDAERLRDRIAARMVQRAEAKAQTQPSPVGVEVERNVAYGDDKAQTFDVYHPKAARGAAIVVMVHGGGWRIGDKAMGRVVDNKIKWLSGQGIIFVSINYRMLPQAGVAEQAADVARAVAAVQAKANLWGGDPAKVVLMGHSAGAHLVALLTADPRLAAAYGAKSWRGAVALDSAAMNVPAIMKDRHFRLYDEAFGKDPAVWQALSPFHQMQSKPAPMLLVCSSRRTDSCPQAKAFADRAESLGGKVSVLPQDLSHSEINANLGEAGAYTEAVQRFIAAIVS